MFELPRHQPRRFGAGRFLTLVLLALACSSPEPTDYAGHGVTIEIDREHHAITIDHEAIPGFMQAMTMTFAVAPEVELESLAPGTRVDFTLRSQGQSLTLTEIHPAASR